MATALRLATPDKTDVLIGPATRRANALVDICRFEVTDPDGIVRETSPPRAEMLW